MTLSEGHGKIRVQEGEGVNGKGGETSQDKVLREGGYNKEHDAHLPSVFVVPDLEDQ